MEVRTDLNGALSILARYRDFFSDTKNKVRDFIDNFLKFGPVPITKSDIVAIGIMNKLGLIGKRVYVDMMVSSIEPMFKKETVVKLMSVSCTILNGDPDGMVVNGKRYLYEIGFECVDTKGGTYIGSCLFDGKRKFLPYRHASNSVYY